MSVTHDTIDSKQVQIWDNAAFDNGESEIKFSWSNINMKPLTSSINLSDSFQSDPDATKENHFPDADSPLSLKSLSSIKQHNNTPLIPNSQQKDIDVEIKEIEKVIHRLSSRLESLRLQKAKINAKVMEKKGRVIAAKFLDPPKHNTRSSNEHIKELKTPTRGLSLGPNEIMRGVRRGISLGPAEIYSATKFRKQEMITTPVQHTANRRKSCYWKLHDIDELRATKQRGKSLSLSPKSRAKNASKAQVSKQAATTVACRKTLKKEDSVISSIQPKKLFTKDAEKSATAKKPVKPGRVVASRYNQASNVGNSAMKELRKRSLPENEEDLKRSDKKRVSVTVSEKSQSTMETRVKKKWDIPSELIIPNNEMILVKTVDHKTPSSVSKMLDRVPKIKNMHCINESPRDSGPAKRVADLIGRKSFFNMEDGIDEEVEESVCQSLSFAEEQVVEDCLKIRNLRHIDETPRDSGAAKRVSQLVGRKTFFNEDDDDEMPVFSFEEEDAQGN